jgi:hypothetical protein
MLATPASLRSEGLDLGGMALHQAGRRRHGAAHAEHAGATILRIEPVAIEPVMDGGRAEIPDDRLLAAGQQREAAELVALPFADLGARHVADVVDVEEQQRAALRCISACPGAGEPIALQPTEVDTGLEIDIGVAGSRDVPVPIPMRGKRLCGGRFGIDDTRRDNGIVHGQALPDWTISDASWP